MGDTRSAVVCTRSVKTIKVIVDEDGRYSTKGAFWLP